MITLRTLGACVVQVGSRTLTPASDRAFAAVVWLAAHSGRPVPRATLAALLWPREEAVVARRTLRQLLYRLRRHGVPLRVEGDVVTLPSTAIARTPAADPSPRALRAALRTDDWPRGGWLPGYEPEWSAPLGRWIEDERDRLDAALRRGLERLLEECRRAREAENVSVVAEALARLDPLAHGVGGATSVAATTADQMPLVGRDRERAALRAALARAVRGEGGVVAIRGVEGVGRTRLLAACGVDARAAGVVTIHADAGLRPDGAWRRSLAASLIALPGALGCAPDTLTRWRAIAGDLAAHEMDADARPGPACRASPRGEELEELVDAVVDERPLCVLVDDAHRLGPRDRALLSALADAAEHRALLVVVSEAGQASSGRPDHARRREHGTLGVAHTLALAPLGDPVLRRLVRACARGRGHSLLERDAVWCVAQAAGRPGRVPSLVDACHARVADRSPEVPSALRVACERTLAGRTVDERLLLLAIASLGAHARAGTCAEALASSDAHATLEALLNDGCVHESPEGRLVIRDPILRDVLLRPTTRAPHRMLHARIAAALERAGWREAGAPAPGRARAPTTLDAAVVQWAYAGEPDRAAEVAIRRAGRCGDMGAPMEALRVLDRCGAVLSSHDDGGVRSSVRRLDAARANALRTLLSVGEASRALRALGGAPHPTAPPRLRLVGIHAAWSAGRPSAATREAMRAELCALLDAPGLDATTRLEAALLAVGIAELEVDVELAAAARVALESAALGAPSEVLLRARMAYEVSFGSPARGLAAARGLRAHLDARALAAPDLASLQNVAEALHACGRTREALEVQRGAYAAAVTIEADAFAARAADRGACWALACGDTAAAWAWAQARARRRRSTRGAATLEARDAQARLLLARGAARDALGLAEASWEAAADAPPRVRRALLTTLTDARLACGAATDDVLGALEALHATMAERTGHDRAVSVYARALARGGYVDDARIVLTRYLRRERRVSGALDASLAAAAASIMR